MIIPDSNLVVYAYDEHSKFNGQARRWWESLLSGDETVGLPWLVILAFLRIITNRRALTVPLRVNDALEAVQAWLEQPNVQLLVPGPLHFERLASLLREVGVAGDLTMDAHLAAMAIELQATVHTADADFSRFSGVRWTNPLSRT